MKSKKGKSVRNLGVMFMLALLSVCMIPSVSAEPNFQVMIDGKNPVGVIGGAICKHQYTIAATVKNVGTYGKMRVEGGIYETEQVKQWYPSIITPILNCQQYETNVATKEITLDAGESEFVLLEVTVPADTYAGWYTVHVQAFKNCWTPETPIVGQTDYDTAKIAIVCTSPVGPTCRDGVMNQDETSTDCGGAICKKCPLTGYCKLTRDCEVGLYCLAGRCAKSIGGGGGGGDDGGDDVVCLELYKGDNARIMNCLYNQNKGILNTVGLILLLAALYVVIPKLRG